MKTLSSTPDPSKSIQSAEIAEQTAAWLKAGGKIQQVPPGAVKTGEVDALRQYPERRVVEVKR